MWYRILDVLAIQLDIGKISIGVPYHTLVVR